MVSLAAETLFKIGSFPVTNSLLHTFAVDIIIVAAIIALNKNLTRIPGYFQNTVELVIEGFYDLTESVSGKHLVAKIFPYFMSFFVFILIANWSMLIPGFNTFGFYKDSEFVPFLKGATSDINTTLGLALVSAAATHILSLKTIGFKQYLGRYFSFNPIYLFVGILELIGEITKIVSLSFRLFGNIFAGEVVLSTVSGMFAYLLPIPFMSLEIIVGLVQALVFAMLTMAFMAILATAHGEGGEHA